MLSQDFKEFVELLNRYEVEYLIVGGYAVGIHGHPRYTGDLDIWIHATVENARKTLRALNDFGFASFGLNEADLTKFGNVIQMGYPPFRIDILTRIDGVDFEDCYRNKVIIQYDGIVLYVIGVSDLMVNKRASGRLKDIDDLENLKHIE